MTETLEELTNLRVSVEEVIYMPSLDAPEDRPHPFVYFISIANESDSAVTIKGRKWVITQSNGEKVVVEGEGVVSQNPEIESGGDFSYNSYHVIANDSVAEGSFLVETEDGRALYAKIPQFEMKIPKWA
ncbi:MAG: ApaG domain [Verrucomicrobiota bacterium]